MCIMANVPQPPWINATVDFKIARTATTFYG